MSDATKAPELLPCPFCGGDAHIHTTKLDERCGYMTVARAQCIQCGATVTGRDTLDQNGWVMGTSDAKDKAIASWNRRATPAALIREAEARGREAALAEMREICQCGGGPGGDQTSTGP